MGARLYRLTSANGTPSKRFDSIVQVFQDPPIADQSRQKRQCAHDFWISFSYPFSSF